MNFKSFSLVALILAFSFTVMGQNNQYVQTNRGKLAEIGKVTSLVTTNATATLIDSIAIADNTAGIVTAEVVGMNALNGDGITGKVIMRYSKASGTLTLGSPAAILAIVADTGLSGGTFAFSATTSNNLQLKVTGKASTTVKWRSTVTQGARP